MWQAQWIEDYFWAHSDNGMELVKTEYGQFEAIWTLTMLQSLIPDNQQSVSGTKKFNSKGSDFIYNKSQTSHSNIMCTQCSICMANDESYGTKG